MKNKRTKISKFINILFICVIAFVLTAGLVRTVFFPKDINIYENRYSNKLTAPTVSSFLDSTFQTSIEDALSDQIVGAQRLKKFYNETLAEFSNRLVRPILKKNDKTYISYKNGSKFFNGYYVYSPQKFKDIEEAYKIKAKNYNAVFEKYPDIDFYVYYIEKDTDINFENSKKLNADDYLFSLLNTDSSRERSYEIENFEDFSENFYKTDHHWKHTGSYKAYLDVADFLGCKGEPIEKGKEVLICEEFMGSKAAVSGSNIVTEKFYAYEFDFPEFKNISGVQEDNYGSQEKLISGAPVTSVGYGEFYGGDDGEVIFDTGKTEYDNILIIGESYDNAILKLLATHFNKTHSIDLRYYEHYKESKFNFSKYVKANDIDKVLFIGNSDFYYLNTFELENY